MIVTDPFPSSFGSERKSGRTPRHVCTGGASVRPSLRPSPETGSGAPSPSCDKRFDKNAVLPGPLESPSRKIEMAYFQGSNTGSPQTTPRRRGLKILCPSGRASSNLARKSSGTPTCPAGVRFRPLPSRTGCERALAPSTRTSVDCSYGKGGEWNFSRFNSSVPGFRYPSTTLRACRTRGTAVAAGVSAISFPRSWTPSAAHDMLRRA